VEFIHLTALFEEEVERCLAFDPLVGEQLDSARARLYGELPKLYRLFDGLDANVLRNWVGNLSTYEFSHMPSAAIILETVERILSGRGFEGKLTYDQLRERTAGLAREIGGRYTSVRTLLDFVYLGETDEEARHQLAEVVHQVCAGLVSRSKLTDGFAARFKKAAARAVPVREPR
jgi:hypothetical protein